MPRHTSTPYTPRPTRDDRSQAALDVARLAVYDALDYTSKPDNGWGSTRREDTLCTVQKAQYVVNEQLAQLIMARDALELAMLSLQPKDTTITVTTASTSEN